MESKILILLPSVWLFNVSFTPPNPPPDESERVRGPFYEHIVPTISPVVYRVCASLPCMAEAAVMLAARYPSWLSSEVLSRLVLSGQLPDTPIDRYFLAGCVLIVIGSLGRIWCFRTLRHQFTYELSVRKDHTLVTSGPYAIVRHPSYVSAGLSALGLMLVITGPGSFARRCGWLETTFGKLFVGSLAAIIMLLWLVACSRCRREDGLLRERFREEWDRYSRTVRYWMIPGVL